MVDKPRDMALAITLSSTLFMCTSGSLMLFQLELVLFHPPYIFLTNYISLIH